MVAFETILKEISPEYSLEGLILKLKLQYFGYLMRRADSLEKTLILGKIEVRRRRGWQRTEVEWHHWLSGHEFQQAPRDCEGHGGLACCSPWGHKDLDATEWMNNKNYLGHESKEKWSQRLAQHKNINTIDIKYRYRTQRDGMGREEGGGFRMENTCIPVADSFWYLAKLIQLCKV